MIRLLKEKDLNAWMVLAGEVEPLFGPMTQSPEFRQGIGMCIDADNAYGVEDENGRLAGIMAIDRDKNEILWLAVSRNSRGRKLGDRLVKKAVEELQSHGDIFVQTFAPEIAGGKAARIIYGRNGFKDFRPGGKNPAGIDTVVMVRESLMP